MARCTHLGIHNRRPGTYYYIYVYDHRIYYYVLYTIGSCSYTILYQPLYTSCGNHGVPLYTYTRNYEI